MRCDRQLQALRTPPTPLRWSTVGSRKAPVRTMVTWFLRQSGHIGSANVVGLRSGTVTFLFTDLVDSTPLWEQQPTAMADAVARHDVVLQDVVSRGGGVVVKTSGDGLMAVFDDADAAVAAAIDGQRALLTESWPVPLSVRMGLCTGSALEADGDYHGPVVNRAARVASAAHGGQILVAPSTAALAEAFELRRLGEYRLKGLPPMGLWQVVADGIGTDFPPLAVPRAGFDLAPATSFVGRARELESVCRLVLDRPLVTLTGTGGGGKTRLAIEVADRLFDRFADGVRFVDLAAVTDGAHVAGAVVAALGLAHDATGSDPVSRLARYLGERAVLCVLDNCEHVVDACAALAQAAMDRSGSSRILATSLAPLGVVGEQVYVVPSLDVDSEAVHLFAERAGEARAGFVVDDTNRATITQVCRHLDGIPLAIELAAARMAHLSPSQLLERLDDRLALLTAERRVPRHQTLAATLDWSYDLLNAREQEVLRCVAVFPASFTLEAAEAVVGSPAAIAGSGVAVEMLGSLVAKSLVQLVDTNDRLRYRLLETVRLYAHNRRTAGEAKSSGARHRDWVLDWLESIPIEQRWLGDTDPSRVEHANIVAALEWSAARGDVEAVARITAGTDWRRDEHWQEGIRWCETAVAAEDALSTDLRVQLYAMFNRLGLVATRGLADWTRIADRAQRAIAGAGGKPSPFQADLRGHRAGAIAAEAVENDDQSLAQQAIELAEACVIMDEQFAVPWRMWSRLAAGVTYATLALRWHPYVEGAERHHAAGIAVAPPTPPYLGLHADLCMQLAVHRAMAGDTSDACALARQAQDNMARVPEYGHLEAPLTLALIMALESVTDLDAVHAELCAYHNATQRHDWGLGATETAVLYGGFLAALREDWELASRLLAAGRRSVYGSPAKGHLYAHFRHRIREAVGPELSHKLRAEGQAMSLSDALTDALR